MAKGNVAKQTIADKLKKLFGNNFILLEGNKVYVWEDDGGERIQVALTMTCPKTPVGAAMASPEPASAFDNYITPNGEFVSVQKNTTEITPEEQQTIKDLMARLGL